MILQKNNQGGLFINMDTVKKFELHWLSGDVEIISGYDIADAFMKAGYGGGSMNALDYYKEIK